MSWFDTAGLANLAKTALKEAQKQIDKALDIKDDDPMIKTKEIVISKTEPTTPSEIIRQSNSSPSLSAIGLNINPNVWGSFTGSFFDTPSTDNQETVTTPPTSLRKIDEFNTNHSKSTLSSTSESLEILSNPTTPGSSITSPGTHHSSASTILGSESVEVLGIDTPTSEIFSSTGDLSSIIPSNINSPSSVEIISDELVSSKDDNNSIVHDDDDDSISYNTISDSVTAVTVVEPTENKSINNTSIITVPPSRSSLHLSLGGSFNISSISDESNDSDRTIESNPYEKRDTVNQSTASVLIEDAMMDKLSDISTQLSDSTQSFEDIHPSNLLSLSYQCSEHLRHPDTSPPLSSDSKNSDLVKISSTQTSEHNSGDEIETATSSDIEIISSPNGDSSSTNSIYRVSPRGCSSSSMLAKSRGFEILGGSCGSSVYDSGSKKGHSRELSEISIKSDDSSQTENEKLQHRVCELQELLEAREYKLLELGRNNAELQERYTEILEKLQPNLEINNVTEEYTQRLSALEKKFQQSIRERDHLRKQLDTAKTELNSRIDKEYFDNIVKEKELIATELRQEGEKLSKQVLQHSNILKKLRTKEKELEITLKKQNQQIEEFTEETERLKKSLSAKDEVERSQIEAVHKLSSEKRKLEKENYQLTSQLDDIQQKLETCQKSFEAAKKELSDKKQAHTELTKKTEEILNLDNDRKLAVSQNEQMQRVIDELRETLKQVTSGSSLREQKLRLENTELLHRVEEAELRAEENSQSITLSTIPLVKQLESLQMTLNTRTLAWDKREKVLLDQLEEAQNRLSNFNDFEQSSKEQVTNLNLTICTLEDKLSSSLLKTEQSISVLQQKELELELLQRDYKKEIESLKTSKFDNETQIEKLKHRLLELDDALKQEKENFKLEKQKEQHLHDGKRIMTSSSSTASDQDDAETIQGGKDKQSMGSSPTHSLAKLSFSDGQGSNVWPLDDFDYIPSIRPSGPESLYGSNNLGAIGHAPFLESLQAALKQRDGEVHQLQWELSRLHSERTYLTTEISNLTTELDQIKEKFESLQNIEEQFIELQHKYDAILQMYGEKVEETQELKLDLQDVKEMYKAQIDELLRQQKKMLNYPFGDTN